MEDSFYWYDLETTGKNPKWDRIVQFAGIRTDRDLSPLGDPDYFFIKLADDVLPSPEATLITGITPGIANSKGISELEAVSRIDKIFSKPKTCVVGFNSLRFDDEFIRYTFYRSLYDPYSREYKNENSRWDIIDLVRAMRALRPEGLIWPDDDNGLPVYKLEILSETNHLDHNSAHDALSDVEATIGLARLIKEKQPKLFSYYLGLRRKERLLGLLEPCGEKILVHISAHYPRTQYCLAPIISIVKNPHNKNSIVTVDLSKDIDVLLDLSVDEIRSRFYDRDQSHELPLSEIRINRSPFVADLSVLTPENWSRLQLNKDLILERRARLSEHDIQVKLKEAFKERERPSTPDDPDGALYDGFISNDDRARCESFIRRVGENIWEDFDFNDPRLKVLAQRIKGRNILGDLKPEERQDWSDFVVEKFLSSDGPWLTSNKFIASWKNALEKTKIKYGDSYLASKDMELLQLLAEYYNDLMLRYGISGNIDHTRK